MSFKTSYAYECIYFQRSNVKMSIRRDRTWEINYIKHRTTIVSMYTYVKIIKEPDIYLIKLKYVYIPW